MTEDNPGLSEDHMEGVRRTLGQRQRRRRILYMDPQALIDVMSGHKYFEVVHSKVPSDAKVVGFGDDLRTNSIYVILESDTYDAVRVGDILPTEESPVLRGLEERPCVE